MNNKGRGLVTVVIILAVICIVFLAAGFSLLAAWGGARFWEEIPDRLKNVEDFSIDQTQENNIEGIDRFEFVSVSADMDIVFADTDKVSVVLKGTYRSSKGTVELKKEVVGNTVRIYVDYPKLSGIFNWNETDFIITMPRDMADREIRFITVSGDVDIPAGFEAGRISVNSTSGDVKADDVTCERFSYGNVSGKLYLSGKISEEVRVDTVSGNTDINTEFEMETIYVNSVSGDVDLYFDSDMEFKFDFSTVSGNFNCDFPIYENGGKYDRKGYTDELADMNIDINTVSGDLRIRN
ncbi:MAG: DUF4097 family beta strand repeat protein [Clostridia bacterium]|nr:DUF4097 family beta strand repeat protein [Clostridia bacterium]